ncbi:MAG: fatty acid desaturase [Pseudomonadota bacterium]
MGGPLDKTDDATMAMREILRAGEGPTWLALALCYAAWLLATGWVAGLPAPVGWLWVPIAALAAAFHASLQHEALHGHPTRSGALNEALVFPPLGLLYPYRRFRDLHLRHHRDERLTDPYDDPETWYLAEGDLASAPRPLRWMLEANRTLLGRMLIGPLLGGWGLIRADLPGLLRGEAELVDAWARHAVGLALVFAWLLWQGVPIAAYVPLVALPAAALISVRTFIEHRAEALPGHRTAVVEAGTFWSLLFLNNNLHAVHHAEPSLAWHRLPARYRRSRGEVLARNGGYLHGGYAEVFRRWLLRPREPIAHPFLRRSLAPPPPQTEEAPR